MFKSVTSRRREVRRNLPRKQVRLRQIVGRSHVIWGVALTALFTIASVLMVLQSRQVPAYQPGDLVDRAQVARVEFRSVDLEGTQERRQDARRKAPAVFDRNAGFFEEAIKGLYTLPEVLAKAETVGDVDPKLVERFGLTDAALAVLKSHHVEGNATEQWGRLVDQFISRLQETAILIGEQYQVERTSLARAILLRVSDSQSLPVWEDELISLKDNRRLAERVGQLAADFPDPIGAVVSHYILGFAKPTYTLNDQLTQESRDRAAAAVEDVNVVYQPNQVLVPAGEALTDAGYRLLREHMGARPALDRRLMRSGLFILVALLASVLVGYVLATKPRVAENPMRALALTTLLLGALSLPLLARGIGSQFGPSSVLVPSLLLAIILTIAYDQRFALGIAAIYVLLVGLMLDLSTPMVLMTVVTVAVAIAQLKEVRNRSTFGRVGFLTGLTAAAGVWGVGLVERHLIEGIVKLLVQQSILVFVACILVSFLVLGILPFIERIFRVTTSMTLLELGDMNHPLLKRLAQSAPGTFNHSLQVATLAEAATEAIGARGLLARVGAYYHDIGKIHKPQYFIENHTGGSSRHENLSPAMSLLIIVGHVKDGAEMAREYGLPPSLNHFIESHHGTTLVEYFFHVAKKQKADDDQPEEVEFRYPGPKPRTREAAVLMICDAVESASRTMAEPTAIRIEQLVHAITHKRLMDGQFDACDITLLDLRKIEQAVTKSLCAIYHSRVAYPDSKADSRDDSDEKRPPRAAV